MRALFISTDKKIFQEGSAVRARIVDYGTLFEQLHVVVFTFREEQFETQELRDNVWVHPTNSRARWLYIFDYFRAIWSQVVFAGELAADVVSAQDPAETGLVAWLVALRYRKKLHLQMHADLFSLYYSADRFRFQAQKLLAQFLLMRAAGIRVVSEKIKKDLVAWRPELEERIRVLPIYTDIENLHTAEPTFDLHERYPKYTFIMLSVGRFSDEKNLLFMLEVFKEIVSKVRRAGLVIVGEGPNREKIETYALANNLFPNIVIEPWQEDLVSHYKTANLFLLTSTHEGHGRTLVEAAAAGTPFVASDVGVAATLSPEQKDFVVCPVNDKACFVNKIMGFISDQEKRLKYKLNVRDTILSSVSGNKEEYLAQYKGDFEETFYFREKMH